MEIHCARSTGSICNVIAQKGLDKYLLSDTTLNVLLIEYIYCNQ